LPESRVLVALSIEMFEATSVAVEWVHDEEYGKPDGGSGDSNNAITFRLSADF